MAYYSPIKQTLYCIKTLTLQTTENKGTVFGSSVANAIQAAL